MEAIKNVKFHGPTIFSEIIQIAINYAEHSTKDDNEYLYQILLILTDGVINDIQ